MPFHRRSIRWVIIFGLGFSFTFLNYFQGGDCWFGYEKVVWREMRKLIYLFLDFFVFFLLGASEDVNMLNQFVQTNFHPSRSRRKCRRIVFNYLITIFLEGG